VVINDRHAGTASEALAIPAYGSGIETPIPAQDTEGRFFTNVLKRQAYDELCEIKNDLLIDLTDRILPFKLRQRWTDMLEQVDFVSTDSGSRIERLCRECTAARGNIERLMRHEVNAAGKQKRADTELVMLYNGFNNLANQWWLYKSFPD
jgi:hypothetical protein